MSRWTLLAVAGALLAAAVLTVSGVVAHSRPIRFDPAPGAVLGTAPSQVTGWFTADLRRDQNWTFLRVTDAQGNRVDAGETELSANRRQMSVSLRPNLPAGRYLVTWRTYDDVDGAIFGDCYTFFVGQQAADAALADNLRLDGGRDCQRIDVSARDGTPVPGQTPAPATAPAAEGHSDGSGANPGASQGDGGDGLPVWSLIAGIIGGVIAGGIGGRVLGSNV